MDDEWGISLEKKWKYIQHEIELNRKYVIYGAGIVAYNIYLSCRLKWQLEPICFAVTEYSGASEMIEQIPVRCWTDIEKSIDTHTVIIVATPEIYHEEIVTHIRQSGFELFFCVDAHAEYLLMSEYFRKKGELQLLSDLSFDEAEYDRAISDRFSVYMAKSHKDKVLTQCYRIPKWILPVQAGRVCTDLQIAKLKDGSGDNISYKNPNYCELTVTYWAWKNCRNTYKGICHYRRMLLMDTKQLNQCMQNNIDAILPLPFVCYPNAGGQYRRYIGERDLAALKQVLSDFAPDYLAIWKELDGQQLFYNYNMLIAKEDIFNQYSAWLFEILQQAEKLCDPKNKRADRYAGYLGELLTTLYIFKHKNEWNIAHAEKNWMV